MLYIISHMLCVVSVSFKEVTGHTVCDEYLGAGAFQIVFVVLWHDLFFLFGNNPST